MDVEETLILPELQGTSTIIKDYHLHLVRERERERERRSATQSGFNLKMAFESFTNIHIL